MHSRLRMFVRANRCSAWPKFSASRNVHSDPELSSPINTKKYPQVKQELDEEGFPILRLFPQQRNIFEPRKKFVRESRERRKLTSREESLPESVDWPSAWPTAKTFVPSAVPLPLRQSYQERGVSRGKYANTELLKIQNFLHLTPVAIARHCRALKKFCTPWPRGLDSDGEIRERFPITKIFRDYVHSSPTIRDPRARIVDLIVNIKDLRLDRDDEIKIIKLAEHRYKEESGNIKITASACPTKIQNQDYADYLLTALYFESIKHEKWEHDEE